MKIYIIVNQSHKWDDPIPDDVEYVSTSLEDAENIWNSIYTPLEELSDDKYCYSADLREYSDGYFIHCLENSCFSVLKHVDNLKE